MQRNLTRREQMLQREYDQHQRLMMLGAIISLFIGLIVLPILVGGN